MLPKNITNYVITIIRIFPIEHRCMWLSTEKMFQIFQKLGLYQIAKDFVSKIFQGYCEHMLMCKNEINVVDYCIFNRQCKIKPLLVNETQFIEKHMVAN